MIKMLATISCVKPLSLVSPIVILPEYGELTLVVVQQKNSRWVPDGEDYKEFPKDVQNF